MSERKHVDVDEQATDRNDRENAIIAADDTGMVSNEADIANAEIREAISVPDVPIDSERTT